MELQTVLAISFLLFCSVQSYTEEDVSYYEELISSEIKKADTYELPQNAKEYQHTNLEPVDFGSVDFVVIGAGSAGATAAGRLSEVNKWNVLLLEAGEEENNFTRIPSMYAYTTRSKYNWGFLTAPQNTCALSSGGIQPYVRGKALGGSSAINVMVYTRGNRLDYDNWEAEGNPGWSYQDVLPFFIKSEHAMFWGENGYHGYNGPLSVEYNDANSKKVDVFLQANEELNVPILDYNGAKQLGANKFQFTTQHGVRMSSARAFLEPVRHRPNLKILTDSYVTKILISNETKEAYGVVFSRKNIQYIVKVQKEIVLSGGVIGSPQILMLSGVGPVEHLRQYNIPLIKDLPVGRNMHDHLVFSIAMYTNNSEPIVPLTQAVREYLNGTGPLTTPNFQAAGFYRENLEKIGLPQFEIVISPFLDYWRLSGEDVFQFVSGLEGVNSTQTPLENLFEIYIIYLHPKTRGSVYLNSSDPYEYPIINDRCLADPGDEDLEVALKGFDIILQILDTQAFKNFQPVLLPDRKCSDHTFLSREYFICTLRMFSFNVLHGAGTNKMGPDPLNGGVVSNDLKLHGIRNLRVADASVIPFQLSAHTSAPSIMIGERVADFIKAEHDAI